MKSDNQLVQKHFEQVPRQWDSLYSHENRLIYSLNKLLRKGLFERYRLTFERCGDLTGMTVLDIGCGTGRFSIECAKRGAQKVVGLDFAPSMIEFCREVASQMRVTDKCEFICDDFLAHDFRDRFDIVLALGLFDYIREPEPVFRKIAALRPRKFLASFPTYTLLWGIQRKIRYEWIKKCPIYYYTREQLQRLYQVAPFPNFEIIEGKKGFLGIAEARNKNASPGG